MRVLVSTVPQAGHFHPLFPLAIALRDRGHDVTFATAPSFVRRAENAGFAAVPVGDEFDAWFGELARRSQGSPGEGVPPEEVEAWFTPRLFAQIGTERTLDDLLAAIGRCGADLVVHDAYQFAAPLAAALAGIPNVAHGLGPLPYLDIFSLAGDAVAPLWAARGLAAPELAGVFTHACLTVSPPSLDIAIPRDLAARVHALQPVGYDAASSAARPHWLDRLPDRPVVYATLGTMFNTNRAVFRAILDGLADEDVTVVMTVGEQSDPHWLDPVPANAHVERYLPQSLLLDRCTTVVSHGGSGTILPALARGIPQVLLPQGADNFTNAARCERAGAGIAVPPGAVSADSVHAALHRALDDASVAAAARRIADEIAAMPTPSDAAEGLERLVSAATR